MYRIDKCKEYLLVRFHEDFDYHCVQTIIQHLTSIKEYPFTNDLWLIGSRRADIHLRDIDEMVSEFHCNCPVGAGRSKTAIVVDSGMTESVMRIWISAVRKRVAFDIRMFKSLPDACSWLDVAVPKLTPPARTARTSHSANQEVA
ncbi:MAG: hypothetical protein JXR25_09710 [Pontiellaceae bacterium]|nr:hypothetical protein [Pontiellaceae bacterium]MBN2785093.1 hypothetical protein [Pontiellaceae bacterium]